ncbi:unnamed protein product [Caenorhabditis sp. 36 PRJEB53466]|nr:unnamed protein product [Caenorhabditis sp. 36 PRJEB53466]
MFCPLKSSTVDVFDDIATDTTHNRPAIPLETLDPNVQRLVLASLSLDSVFVLSLVSNKLTKCYRTLELEPPLMKMKFVKETVTIEMEGHEREMATWSVLSSDRKKDGALVSKLKCSNDIELLVWRDNNSSFLCYHPNAHLAVNGLTAYLLQLFRSPLFHTLQIEEGVFKNTPVIRFFENFPFRAADHLIIREESVNSDDVRFFLRNFHANKSLLIVAEVKEIKMFNRLHCDFVAFNANALTEKKEDLWRIDAKFIRCLDPCMTTADVVNMVKGWIKSRNTHFEMFVFNIASLIPKSAMFYDVDDVSLQLREGGWHTTGPEKWNPKRRDRDFIVDWREYTGEMWSIDCSAGVDFVRASDGLLATQANQTSHENINSPIDSSCSSDTSSQRSDSGTDAEEDYQAEFEEDCYTEGKNKAILEDTMKYDERMASWAKLSDEDLSRMYFLLSTTQSKRAISRYFDCTEVANEMNMKKLLFENTRLTRVDACVVCANDVMKCGCSNGVTPCELVFCDITSLISQFMDVFGQKIMNTHAKIKEKIPTSSPLSHGKLNERFLDCFNASEIKLNFIVGFDGIRLQNKSRMKCWPSTIASLDMEDRDRASTKAVLTVAMFMSASEPSSAVHDRVMRWLHNELELCTVWNGFIVRGNIVTGAFDDPARRKVFGLKGHSSKGSCAFCLNQSTRCKRNDGNVLMRSEATIPRHLEDGLRERGKNTYFHEICPMYECPLDFFHVFSEGVFEKITSEIFGHSKYEIFKNCDIDRTVAANLPSRFRQLSGRHKEITGSERTHLFESVLLYSAFTGKLPPIAAAIIIAFHGLYRLNVDPISSLQWDLPEKVEKVATAIRPLVEKFAPQLLHGSKVHQILYHMADSCRIYGSLQMVGTQMHEHAYHVIKRNLAPEITNGVSSTILRNVSLLQELASELCRRLTENPDLTESSVHARKLSGLLSLDSPGPRSVRTNVIPVQFEIFSRRGDFYAPTVFHNGIRYSSERRGRADDTRIMFNLRGTVQYGTVKGFLLNTSRSTRIIVVPFLLSDGHFEILAQGLVDAGVSKPEVQNIMSILSNVMKQMDFAESKRVKKRGSPLTPLTFRRDPLKKFRMEDGEEIHEEPMHDEIHQPNADQFNLVEETYGKEDGEDEDEVLDVVNNETEKTFAPLSLCPFIIGEESLRTPPEQMGSFKKYVSDASIARLDFDFTNVDKMIDKGSSEVKAIALGMRGLMQIMMIERERQTPKKPSLPSSELITTLDPTKFLSIQRVVVQTLDKSGEIDVNETLAKLSVQRGTLRNVVHLVGNHWINEIMQDHERSKWSVSLKPQEPNKTIPAEMLNAPAGLLAKVLKVKNADEQTIGQNIAILFKLHLANIFNHSRSTSKKELKRARGV